MDKRKLLSAGAGTSAAKLSEAVLSLGGGLCSLLLVLFIHHPSSTYLDNFCSSVSFSNVACSSAALI